MGLGADLVRPLSWVMDRSGLYYNASQPSDLEHLLLNTDFSPALKARAAQLRARILALGVTKYNVGQTAWSRPDTPGRWCWWSARWKMTPPCAGARPASTPTWACSRRCVPNAPTPT
ncbi:capsular polysaccharide export protein, LipB/KpsS family [Ideonella paludis]|uniref:capsular polysaccharide export protein, LipB/KpsS family n=1 Tax=Ideonella paludis TaxID=1233411 RepID=UPI00363CDAFA